jgi:preprotein translocase subunit SecE
MARSQGVPRRVDNESTRRAFSFKFFGEVYSELRRVTWPTREETTRLTIMVLAVAAAVGVFLGLVDIGFSRLISVILGN